MFSGDGIKALSAVEALRQSHLVRIVKTTKYALSRENGIRFPRNIKSWWLIQLLSVGLCSAEMLIQYCKVRLFDFDIRQIFENQTVGETLLNILYTDSLSYNKYHLTNIHLTTLLLVHDPCILVYRGLASHTKQLQLLA